MTLTLEYYLALRKKSFHRTTLKYGTLIPSDEFLGVKITTGEELSLHNPLPPLSAQVWDNHSIMEESLNNRPWYIYNPSHYNVQIRGIECHRLHTCHTPASVIVDCVTSSGNTKTEIS